MMLSINTEFRKGIFFIRLDGSLTKETIDEFRLEVTNLIEDNGIRNILFNFNNLKSIDYKGINELYYIFELCELSNGLSLICGINDNIKNIINKTRITKYIKQIDNELYALTLI